MRRFFLIASFCLTSSMAPGQQLPEQTPAATWHFDDMSGTAVVLLFKNDSARVQKDTANLVFAIQQQGPLIKLSSKPIDTQALQLLGLSPEAVNIQYGPDHSNLLPTEKLLTAASRLPDRKLLLEGKDVNDTSLLSPDSAGMLMLAEEEPAGTATGSLTADNPWLYAAIALALGFIIGWLVKPRKKQVAEVAAIPSMQAASAAPDAALQQEVAQLRQQLSLGQRELSRLKEEDQRYYTALFDQLLLPMQESLEQNKNSHLLAQMITAAALLNSLTRHKLGKKGKYDDANLQLLTGSISSDLNAPLITAATPPDQIPHHLRGLIALMKEHGISGLGDLVVNGYRVKDL